MRVKISKTVADSQTLYYQIPKLQLMIGNRIMIFRLAPIRSMTLDDLEQM